MGEMLRFPAGTHDDIVDALAWAARMFRTAPRPLKAQYVNRQREKSWKEDLEGFGVRISGGSTSQMSN